MLRNVVPREINLIPCEARRIPGSLGQSTSMLVVARFKFLRI